MQGIIREVNEEVGVEFKKEDTVYFKLVCIDKFEEMFKNNEIVPSVDFNRSDWEKAIELI